MGTKTYIYFDFKILITLSAVIANHIKQFIPFISYFKKMSDALYYYHWNYVFKFQE